VTVYYAQQSSVNIDAANLWNTAANGSGSYVAFGDLTSADVLMANGKTSITINVDTTVDEVRTDNANGATAGGGFILADGVTLTANPTAGSTVCVTFSANLPAVGYIVGNAAVAGNHAISQTGTGTLTITGNCSGGTGGYGAYLTAAGIMNIIGNVTGSAAANIYGARATAGVLNITGNCYGGGGTNSHGVYTNDVVTINVTGNVYGGAGDNACGAHNNASGAMYVNGNAYAHSTTATAAGIQGFASAGTTVLYGAAYANASGAIPVKLYVRFGPSASLYLRNATLQEKAFTPVENQDHAAIANVRHGTSYALGALTGTAYIPAASSVVAGVPVDATVGTADLLTAADVRSAIGLASANLDTQLAAIPTSGLTAQQVWEYVSRTLTAGSGITAQDVWEYATRSLTESPDVPTAEEIAAEVRTELTTELSRVANCATVESTGDQLASLL
jgi:hypothetical protein